MPQKKQECLHKKIIFSLKEMYYIKNGYEQSKENDEEWDLIKSLADKTKCVDCGKILD